MKIEANVKIVNEIICFAHKGCRQEKCKDIFRYKRNNNSEILGLCDGVSTQKFSDIGALEVQKDVCELLEGFGGNLQGISDEELKYRIACTVNETMFRLSKERRCEEVNFASTLMLMIKPYGEDFYWTAHIGDGIIAVVDEKKQIEILSNAENGITKQYTYTTASGNLMKRLRLRRHRKKGFVCMMTDGITNEVIGNKKYLNMMKNRNWRIFERELINKNISDDIGFIGMEI